MTSYERIVGDLTELPKTFEWKMLNFFTYDLGGAGIYRSSSFSFANTSWHLRLSKKNCNYLQPGIMPPLSVSLVKESGPFPGVIIQRFSLKADDSLFMGKSEAFNCLQVSELPEETFYKVSSQSKNLTIACYLKCEKQTRTLQQIGASEMSKIEALQPMKLAETDVLSKNLKDLFTNSDCCDIVLQVEDKEFKVHKFILIARSPVFAAMFHHDTSENQTGIINIPDCDSGYFYEFLEYLYCGKLEDISFDSAVSLYRTSDKYDVQELKTFCLRYMMENLTVQNVCDTVILADEYDESKLLSTIQEFFNENLKKILVTSEWEGLLKKNYRLANKLLIEMSNAKH